jgi:dynein heavy chain
MVNTSDIRRAHTSILSNIKHGDGVLLQGPSGTGKTESLKELGRCMAKYCVIFNCSSEVNIRTLQKLLSGLCYTGSWLCLDEINRLTAEIMSVVASQIHSVKSAVVQGKEVFSFMGKDMRLRKGVGIFSTMNPIYLKRAKLTESLKSYFRVISVNVPDYEKILEVMLYGLGIAASSAYAHKISTLFKNLSIQLSLRSQYDFGLRAMKFFTFNLAIVRKTVRS